MKNFKAEEISKIKLKIILGTILSFIILIIYTGCSMLFEINNANSLQTIFTEESLYASSEACTDSSGFPLNTKNDIVYILEAENPILYNIDPEIPDSVENENQEIDEQHEEDTQAVNDSESKDSENQSVDEDSTSSGSESSSTAEIASSAGSSSVESDIIHMINNIRADRGLQLLNPNPILNSIARSRSQDMINRGYFSHSTPEGKNLSDILVENGVMYACIAENLSQASPPSWGSPDAIINLWMNSSQHRANLLNPHYGQLGLGIADGNGRRVVTLIFMNR